jgi:ribose 1,5-bisphosphate isomerase
MPDIVNEIKALHIQSASTIALKSMYYLRSIARKEGFKERFFQEADRLEKARPTAVILHNCLDIVRKEKTMKSIENVIERLTNSKKGIAKNAVKIFPKKKNVTILTHCHSTNVVSSIISAKNFHNLRVFVTETRPRDQGLFTAKDLLNAKIPVDYIIDSAIGMYIRAVDFVLVGSDALRKEGVINKIGTYPLAVVAKENNKPFYVVSSTLALDKRNKFVIEERPHTEITHKHLIGAKLHNPAFDITPWKYVSAVIMENGIFKPNEIKKMLR